MVDTGKKISLGDWFDISYTCILRIREAGALELEKPHGFDLAFWGVETWTFLRFKLEVKNHWQYILLAATR